MHRFIYTGLPARVVFADGAVAELSREIDRLGARRVLVLTTPQQRGDGDALAAGARRQRLCRRHHAHAGRRHRGRAEAGAVLRRRLPGGARRRLDHRPVQGDRAAHRPAADRHPDHLCRLGDDADPRRDQGRPQDHAEIAESPSRSGALRRRPDHDAARRPVRHLGHQRHRAFGRGDVCARIANPIIGSLAEQSIAALVRALPRIAADPGDREARSDAQYGAFLAGVCLGSVGMALHHKLCHTLGGMFDLPHSETHTIVLPHALAYNSPSVPRAMAAMARAVGEDDVPRALFDLAGKVGAPRALRDLGMPESGHRPGHRPGARQSVLESAAAGAGADPRADRAGLGRRGASLRVGV